MALDPALWSSHPVTANGARWLPQPQIRHVDVWPTQQSSTAWTRDGPAHPHALLNPGASLVGYDPASSGNSCTNFPLFHLLILNWHVLRMHVLNHPVGSELSVGRTFGRTEMRSVVFWSLTAAVPVGWHCRAQSHK